MSSAFKPLVDPDSIVGYIIAFLTLLCPSPRRCPISCKATVSKSNLPLTAPTTHFSVESK
uniref:Uncharacterized protein n=1 Tax=Cucumis sativus TaxID=3659 RepID=A0A0A0LXS1_CUCSA